jgi:hypothetical protein
MLSPPQSTTVPIPGYNLSPPSEADAVAALQRVYGSEKGAEHWKAACQAAKILPGWVRGRDTLGRVLQSLATQGGPQAVVARSMEIRMRTYDRLAARGATPGGQG